MVNYSLHSQRTQDLYGPCFKQKLTANGLPWWLRWWRICPQCGRLGFDPWVGKILWRREWLPTPVFWPGIPKIIIITNLGFSDSSVGKESACNAGDPSLISGLGRFTGEGIGYTPVFWPGECHGLYKPCDCKESDTTEQLALSFYSKHWLVW